MKAWELLLSESQERMLMVVEKEERRSDPCFLKNGICRLRRSDR